LAGDSSLDNKFWIRSASDRNRTPVNGYERIFDGGIVADVAYFINEIWAQKHAGLCAVNAAIEESRLEQRGRDGRTLLDQDRIVRDQLQARDVLVVSIGGNDVALAPTLKTAFNMLLMNRFNSLETIEKGPAHAWGMSHFVHLFKDRVAHYVNALIEQTKPRLVLICMIYFPDEKQTGSWADRTLGVLKYNHEPKKLQTAIRQMYEHATLVMCREAQEANPGTKFVPVPFFEVMDGSDTSMYIDRVEPSTKGGKLLAEQIVNIIESNL
jgi:hypothetical protein